MRKGAFAIHKLGLTPSDARSEVELWSNRRVIHPTSKLRVSIVEWD